MMGRIRTIMLSYRGLPHLPDSEHRIRDRAYPHMGMYRAHSGRIGGAKPDFPLAQAIVIPSDN